MSSKILRGFLLALASIVVLGIVQYIPVLILKTPNMQVKEGEYIILNYEKGDEKGAGEIFDLLEGAAKELREKLDYSNSTKTKVYVYKDQKSLHIRKTGLITLLFDLEWYIGDNKKDIALIVSPYAEVSAHNHDSILGAAQHELVHTINYQINPRLSYWIDNGVAGYLSNQVPEDNFMEWNSIPSYKDTQTENQIKFGNMGGYPYSYSYIQYIDELYGWNSVQRIVKGESYENVFGKSEQEIYLEWVGYLNNES